MATKLDESFVTAAKEKHTEASYYIDTLANEVRRLEGILVEIEKVIDPNPSPGGDTLWLVKNAVKNLKEQAELFKEKAWKYDSLG